MLVPILIACVPPGEVPKINVGDAIARPTVAADWPASTAGLRVLPPPPLSPTRAFRLFLDAGHGEPTNPGNRSAACEAEQDVMLALAEDVAIQLVKTGRFEVQRSRSGQARPEYGERIKQAEAWPADLILSLHSDARGGTDLGRSAEGCYQVGDSAGFSVLWGEEEPAGAEGVAASRHRYGAALARGLTEAGFVPFDGDEYVGLYRVDPVVPGLFADAHSPKKRIRLLRRPRVPSVIIETHNALDPLELLRWREESTKAAFSSAIGSRLVVIE